MDAKARRNIGAHYTSEENILKLIQPLFLDALWEEFNRAKSNKNKLFEFHKKLRTPTFFDPACGCGNFLVIAYRELRKLELDVLRTVHESTGSRFLDVHQEISVDVDQFYGIEIEEFPAQIAQVALWLMDHQMNVRVSEEFGMYFARIPLKTSPHIVNGNALTLDWNDVLPAVRASYVFGNPPFVGKKEQSAAQKADVAPLFAAIKGSGVLDYVTAWYVKAARYIASVTPAQAGVQPIEKLDGRSSKLAASDSFSRLRGNDKIHCAFVSTNSITQGEQVGLLWGWLLAQGIRIHFAHRTFQWSNEAKGVAAVHCVIIGFGVFDVEKKTIYEYEDIRGAAHAVAVRNINPYLVDSVNTVIDTRRGNISNAPEMIKGNEATDDGHLILNDEERRSLIVTEPNAKKWIRPFLGGDDFLNNGRRWCLWLKGIAPNELRAMPAVMKRVEAVREFRLASPKQATIEKAKSAWLFGENRQPTKDSYIVVPKVSSEKRTYMPLGFETHKVVINNTLQIIPNGTLYDFGVLQSMMHMAWMRTVCGRMKSDYQYSINIVYNNFPWPDLPSPSGITSDSPARGLSRLASSSFRGIEGEGTPNGKRARAPSSPALPPAGEGSKRRAAVEAAAQAVLDARAQYMRPSPLPLSREREREERSEGRGKSAAKGEGAVWPTSTTRSPCRPRWSKPTRPSTAPWMPATEKPLSPATRSAWNSCSSATSNSPACCRPRKPSKPEKRKHRRFKGEQCPPTPSAISSSDNSPPSTACAANACSAAMACIAARSFSASCIAAACISKPITTPCRII